MSERFQVVKNYIYDLGFDISDENKEEELVVINDESKGIKNLIVDCEDTILIIEQFILKLQKDEKDIYKRLLQMNRNVVHGAFVLDEEGNTVLFRDTLQLENLDLNELEATINSLSLALVEHANELIEFSK
jgi:hypothetical protein